MSKIVKSNLPCLDVKGCGSSDARRLYEEGSSYCFSCSKFFRKDHDADFVFIPRDEVEDVSEIKLEEIESLPTRGFIDRLIEKDVCEFYNVKVSYDEKSNINSHFYPYSGGGYKQRRLPKTFSWVGKAGGLFGRDLFNGGGKRLVITEGEIDALTVAQVQFHKYAKFYPVVSIPSSKQTAELLPHRDWIRSFEEVVLCFDMDDAGQEATEKAIRIIGIDKVKICKMPLKDASEVFLKKDAHTLLQCIWDAEKWSPVGIISKEDIWKQIVERNKVPSVPYPPCMAGVNTKLKGMRGGEIALLISGTGAGKSTLIREIVLHILETTEDKVGIISLEESPGETGMKLAGMQLKRNPANEEISEEDLKVGFDKVFGEDRVIVLDHQGSIKDESIITQLEYMCLMGCKYLVIDHITILVSEGADGLTGNEAIDKIMNDLLRVVKRHNAWIGLVSHLRKSPTGKKSFEEGLLPSMDDIRGSGSIKQVSFDIIAFSRNSVAQDEFVRNTLLMAVLKSRTIGLTGQIPGAIYDHKTGRLSALSEESFGMVNTETGEF